MIHLDSLFSTKLLFITILQMSTFQALLAQDFNNVEGTVIDNSGAPIEFANITLFSAKDSTLITATSTLDDGTFSLQVIDKNVQSTLRISFIGYKELWINNPKGNIGKVVLTPIDLQLNEVVVKGTRPMVKLKNDGIQVDVSGTYLSHAGTALDLIGKMPLVTRFGTGIEVQGKGTPLIYINNRLVHDQSELTQLSSSEVKHVEVITSPGAQYTSIANAVIRIITVAPIGEGFSFNDRTTLGFKHYAYLFEQTNLNYRRNGFDLFGTLNYENYRERLFYENSIKQYLPATTIEQHNTGKEFSKYPVYAGKIGLNYNHKTQSFGMFYDFKFKPSMSSGPSENSRYNDNLFKERLDNTFTANRHNRQHLLSAYYLGTVGKWQLSVNIDALWQINDRNTDEQELSSLYPARSFTTASNVCNRLIAGNATASYPVWKGDLRFGTEFSNIHRTDLYVGSTSYITSNDNQVEEITTAMFVESNQTFGSVSANIGLRWESTGAKFYQFDVYSPDQSRTYHNIAPTVSLSFPIRKVKMSLSYARKTSRPAFEQLSSAVKYIDRYTYESGNPNLRPIYRDYLSLSSSWKELFVELEYTSTNNYFMWQTISYPGNSEATLLTMQNMPRFHSFSAIVNYSPTFFGCWHPVWTAGITWQDFQLTHHGEPMKLNHPLGIFRFNNSIHLPWDVWLNVDVSVRTSGNGDNAYIQSYWINNLGLYKSFHNDAWSIKLQLNDLFGTLRQNFITYDALTRTMVNKFYDTRDFSVTFRYNFNAAHSRYKGSGAGNIEKNRF